MKTIFLLLFLSSQTFAQPVKRSIPELVDLLDDKFKVSIENSLTKPVYPSANQNSKPIGNLIFNYKNSVLSSSFKNASDSKEVSIAADFFQGSCGTDKHVVYLINGNIRENGFYNMGSGPWGNDGWVTGQSYRVSDSFLPVKFGFKERKDFPVTRLDNWHGRQVGVQMQKKYQGGVSTTEIFVDNVVDSKTGKLIFVPICEVEKR